MESTFEDDGMKCATLYTFDTSEATVVASVDENPLEIDSSIETHTQPTIITKQTSLGQTITTTSAPLSPPPATLTTSGSSSVAGSSSSYNLFYKLVSSFNRFKDSIAFSPHPRPPPTIPREEYEYNSVPVGMSDGMEEELEREAEKVREGRERKEMEEEDEETSRSDTIEEGGIEDWNSNYSKVRMESDSHSSYRGNSVGTDGMKKNNKKKNKVIEQRGSKGTVYELDTSGQVKVNQEDEEEAHWKKAEDGEEEQEEEEEENSTGHVAQSHFVPTDDFADTEAAIGEDDREIRAAVNVIQVEKVIQGHNMSPMVGYGDMSAVDLDEGHTLYAEVGAEMEGDVRDDDDEEDEDGI